MQLAREGIDAGRAEEAMARAGFRVEQIVPVRVTAKDEARNNRLLRHVDRLSAEPDRLIREYGQAAYETALGKCLFHIYPLLGKLEQRVYLLSRVKV